MAVRDYESTLTSLFSNSVIFEQTNNSVRSYAPTKIGMMLASAKAGAI